jgi:hypothetical protein
MKYNDSMKQFRQALDKKFDKGLQDGRRRVYNPGSITGSLLVAYLLGYNRGYSMIRLSEFETK